LPPDRRPFNVLENYLGDRLSYDQTVERLAEPVEDYSDRDQYEGPYRFLVYTWQTFSIVERTPHDHVAHEKLAVLLLGLKLRDSPEGDDARTLGHEGQLWRDLTLYGPTSQASWPDG